MKRFGTACILGLWLLVACKGKGSRDPQFSVDTAQLKHYDSATAAQRRTDTLLGNIRALLLDTPSTTHDFRTNISVVGDSMRGLSVDGYLNGTINSLAQYVPQFSLMGKGERPIAGRPARWIHYTQDRTGTGLENICYIIPDSGIAFIVTCSALKGRLVQNYPAFERTIRSFTLH